MKFWLSLVFEPYDRLLAELSEQDGVGSVIVMGWPMYADLTLADKHRAAESFARTIIHGEYR